MSNDYEPIAILNDVNNGEMFLPTLHFHMHNDDNNIKKSNITSQGEVSYEDIYDNDIDNNQKNGSSGAAEETETETEKIEEITTSSFKSPEDEYDHEIYIVNMPILDPNAFLRKYSINNLYRLRIPDFSVYFTEEYYNPNDIVDLEFDIGPIWDFNRYFIKGTYENTDIVISPLNDDRPKKTLCQRYFKYNEKDNTVGFTENEHEKLEHRDGYFYKPIQMSYNLDDIDSDY